MKRIQFAVVSVLLLSVSAGAETLDLGGVWRLESVSNRAIACVIDVPGDVHSALFAAKLIPDPYWGCNETNVQWVAKEDWVVSRSFDIDAAFLSKRRVVLEAEDVDTFADIYVNGVKVGETSDRFARWTFDVRAALKEGRNEMRAVFRSAWREADARAARLGRAYPMSNVPWAKNQALVRKPACHAGWDWGPSQMTTGFCGPVRLVAHDGLKVEYVYSDQAFNDDFTHCDLTVFVDVTDADGRAFTVTNRIAIPNPPLWWPNGTGEQKFYTYSVKIGDDVFQNDWHFGYYKDMPLADATVNVAIGSGGDASGKSSVTLSTDKPVFFVWTNVRGVRGEFDDNAFTLLPGRPKTITFVPKDSVPLRDALKSALSVVHVAEVCNRVFQK